MNAGHLSTSSRLQATLRAVEGPSWKTTAYIQGQTGSMAVHSDMAGLKANGIRYERMLVSCSRRARVYAYRFDMSKGAAG